MRQIEFEPPEGLILPEGTKPGAKVEMMAEFQVKPDGRMCLVSIDGREMAGYSDKAEEAEKEAPDEGFLERYNRYQ